MIDHIGIHVRDFERSKAFYIDTLQAIGYELLLEIPASKTGHTDVAGFGENGKADFWIYGGEPNQPRVHVAFRVSTQHDVRAFHEAALKAGGHDNGPPGPRTHYSDGYYGGFVLDPDGHNIEAAYHAP